MKQDAPHLSQLCASALLDAYWRNDWLQIKEIARETEEISRLYSSSLGESERLDVLAGIAFELERFSCREHKYEVDPYVTLLLHLANPERPDSYFGHVD